MTTTSAIKTLKGAWNSVPQQTNQYTFPPTYKKKKPSLENEKLEPLGRRQAAFKFK